MSAAPADDVDIQKLRARLGLRSHGPAIEAALSADDDDETLLWRATRGDDSVLRGAAGLVHALEVALGRIGGRSSSNRPLCVWSAGAGGLAEPLSLLLLAQSGGVDVDVVASDVAAPACEDARTPLLAGRRVAGVPRVLGAGLTRSPLRGHVVDGGLLARLRVACGDLRVSAPAGPFDLIVCREVAHHYRPEIASLLLRHTAEALADHGVLALSVVDALAVGLPLVDEGAGVVLFDRHLKSVRPGTNETGERPATWTLCALLDGDAPPRDRVARLTALIGHVDGAAAAVAAALCAEGRLGDAHAVAEGADDDDGAVVRALCDMRAGRLGEARSLLEGVRARAPQSWVTTWLLAELLARSGRTAEARAALRTTVELLDGDGAPCGELTALLPELHPLKVEQACRQSLEGQKSLWHRP